MKPAVLLIEDSQDDEELALLAFERAGVDVDVTIVRDGEEALRVLREGDVLASYALVLLDIKLPKVDGLDVLRRIRAIDVRRRIPIVVFSSSDAPDDIEQALANGANSYVQKPVDGARFFEVLELIGRYWLGCHTAPGRGGER